MFTIRPGYIVGLKATMKGGVRYDRVDLEKNAATGEVARWETTKIADDPIELKKGHKTRNKARKIIADVCANTPFGLICSESNEDLLNEAIKKSDELCRSYNAEAKFSRIDVHVLVGRIEPNDVKAAKAIADEMGSMVTAIDQAISKADPKALEGLINKAKQMEGILDAEKAELVSEAIKQARKAKRTINKRILKDGEDALIVLKDIQRGSIEKARMSFLDLSETLAADLGDEPPAPATRAVDLDDDDGETPTETGTATAARTVEPDDAEVQAAEARKDFDAVDVPEVTPTDAAPDSGEIVRVPTRLAQ